MTSSGSFFGELRRRRVYQVVALYAAAAWGITEALAFIFEKLYFPEWSVVLVTILFVMGLPVVIFLAWEFQIVEGGVQRTPPTSRKGEVVIVAAMIALLAGTAGLFYLLRPWEQGKTADSYTVVETPPSERSLAVLPFADMSATEENAAFLAAGLHDDLLTKLSKIAALTVISRTSVERYKETRKDIRTIGRELGVSKILEGGVQRAGDDIRVNVQLIDAATDEHLWAETYDRSLTAANIFGIQSEIVESIARKLQADLTPAESEQLTSLPTRNVAAYTAYLKGKNEADAESIESMNQAAEHFQTAVDLDPDFALAYVGLADAYLSLGANFFGGLTVDESNELAEPPLMRALELDPNLGEAHASLGLLRQQQGDVQGAEEAYQRAISLQPNYPRVFRLYGRLRQQQNRLEEALVFFERSLAVDPYSAPANYAVARGNDELGRFDEALQKYYRVVEIEPDHAFAYVYIAAIHYLVHGRADESLIWYDRAARNDVMSPSLQSAQALAYLELGDTDTAGVCVSNGLELGPRTFWPLWTSLVLNMYLRDDVAARADARTLLEIFPRFWGALNYLRIEDLAASRYEAARARYARSYRELTEPDIPDVNVSNYRVAVDLALVLMRLGEAERADDLLSRSMSVIESLPRLGTDGYWVTDVGILALQGRREEALAALEQAIDESWRFMAWYFLDLEPNLESLRNEPKFEALRARVQEDLGEQARRVAELEASGDLLPVAIAGE